MGSFTLVRALPKRNARRVHDFLNIAEQDNSVGSLDYIDNLTNHFTEGFNASLDLILSTYVNIHSLDNLKSKWVNNSLEDTVKLLDMCNVISNNIVDVKQYHMFLQNAMHSMDHA